MKKAPANPRDAYGDRIFVGDIVRNYQPGHPPSLWHRKVTAIGDRNNPHLRGTIMVEGAIAWHSARNFEKVPK